MEGGFAAIEHAEYLGMEGCATRHERIREAAERDGDLLQPQSNGVSLSSLNNKMKHATTIDDASDDDEDEVKRLHSHASHD